MKKINDIVQIYCNNCKKLTNHTVINTKLRRSVIYKVPYLLIDTKCNNCNTNHINSTVDYDKLPK